MQFKIYNLDQIPNFDKTTPTAFVNEQNDYYWITDESVRGRRNQVAVDHFLQLSWRGQPVEEELEFGCRGKGDLVVDKEGGVRGKRVSVTSK